MSSFLGTGGACSFNLDLIKSTSSTSGCSSTLSKSSSVSSLAISTKRARGPRKRPNQSYIEAATLLSTACPNVFSAKNLHKKYSGSLSSISSTSLSSSDIIPPLPLFNETNFLIEEPCLNPSFQFKIKPITPVARAEESCILVRETSPPCSPPGYDVDSIFGDESVEGIDSIMGKLSVNDCDFNPFVGGPMGFGIRGKCELGFGLGQHGDNIPQALRGYHCEDWQRQMPMVQMKDIVPKFNPLPLLGKKKTKTKKKKLEDVTDGHVASTPTIATSITSPCKLFTDVNSGLGLKLNYEEVADAWGDRGYPLPCDSDTSPGISAMGDIDLLPETEGVGMREASVQRYLEKRRTRDFSNKIRYQVRKANADSKPRMKGRFVRKTPSFHEASREDDQ